MAYGVSKAFNDVLSRRDKTTIRGVDSTERIFYISPYWMKEILIRNNGTNDVQIRLSERENPITIPAGKELNLSGEFAYFLASASATQNIEILYRPSRKLIAKRVPPIALYHDGVDDYVFIPYNNKSLDFSYTRHFSAFAFVSIRKVKTTQFILSKCAWRRIQRGFGIRFWKGKYLEFKWGTGTSQRAISHPYTVVTKGHNMLVFTADGINAKAWINLDFSQTTLDVPLYGKDTYDVYIGKFSPSVLPFEGISSQVLLYNRGLSDREINHNYKNSFEPIRKGLVLYLSPYSIDIVNGKWYDLSGQENHGTIYGATLKELWRPEQ